MYICRWHDGVVTLAGKCDRLRMQFACGMFSRGSMDEREREFLKKPIIYLFLGSCDYPILWIRTRDNRALADHFAFDTTSLRYRFDGRKVSGSRIRLGSRGTTKGNERRNGKGKGEKRVCEMPCMFHECYRLHGNTSVDRNAGATCRRETCGVAGRTTFFLIHAINFHLARALDVWSPLPPLFSIPSPGSLALFFVGPVFPNATSSLPGFSSYSTVQLLSLADRRKSRWSFAREVRIAIACVSKERSRRDHFARPTFSKSIALEVYFSYLFTHSAYGREFTLW